MRDKRQQVIALSVAMLAGATWYATTRQSSLENSTPQPDSLVEQSPVAGTKLPKLPTHPAPQSGQQLPLPGVDLGLGGLEDRPEIELVEGLFSPPTYGLSNWMSLDQRLRRNLSQMLIDRAKLEMQRGNRTAARAAAREALDQVLAYASPAVPSDLKPPMGIHGEQLAGPPGGIQALGSSGIPSLPPPPQVQTPGAGKAPGDAPLMGGQKVSPGQAGPGLSASQTPRGLGDAQLAQAPGAPDALGKPGEQLGPPPGQEAGLPQDLDERPLGPRVRNAFEHGWFGAAALCYVSLWPEESALLEALPAARLSSPEGAVAQGMLALLQARALQSRFPERSKQSAQQAFGRLSEVTSKLVEKLKQEPTLAAVQGFHALGGDPTRMVHSWGWLSPDFALNQLEGYLSESNRLSGSPASQADPLSQLQATLRQIREERRQPTMSSAPYWTTDRALGRVPT